MKSEPIHSIQTVYPRTFALYPKLETFGTSITSLPDEIEARSDLKKAIPYLSDLAKIELAQFTANQTELPPTESVLERIINPTLSIIQTRFRGLARFISDGQSIPQPGSEILFVFKPKPEDEITIGTGSNEALLALKMVVEHLSLKHVAEESGKSLKVVDQMLVKAVNRGLIFEPESKLARPMGFSVGAFSGNERFRRTKYFTLQWHITQQCDLSCLHCYDRTRRQSVSLEDGKHVLDELEKFCEMNRVRAQVSFSGGNPFLHPAFPELYQEAVDRGFMTAILGNPVSPDKLQTIQNIHPPEFYQISLEGLREHNDTIRGRGSFDRAIAFLDMLKKSDIYSMVMLTLTRDNMSQVLPLAEALKDKADRFTFNRLSMVGEGASLISAPIDKFSEFLSAYLTMAGKNSHMSMKDSLFNIIRNRAEKPLFGGCTGFGCGAAFNFVSLLADGEIHACRKLPSLIGNIHFQGLDDIYNSPIAQRYRNGASECKNCKIRPVCGGCLAVSYGFGQDIFRQADPYCFYTSG